MFQLTNDQREKFSIWRKEQDEKVAKMQKTESPPYYGCNGGGYSYIFVPTSLGLITVVKNNVTQEEINLTKYEDW